jgi:hypothetical protein
MRRRTAMTDAVIAEGLHRPTPDGHIWELAQDLP